MVTEHVDLPESASHPATLAMSFGGSLSVGGAA
jgi:hypothetical protein